MGILQNANREFCGVFRIWGGTVLNSAYPQETVGNWHLTGKQRNLTAGEGITDDKVGVPLGLLHPASWIMPQKPGMLSSRNEINSALAFTGSIAGGKNADAALTGTGTLAGTAQLIVSGTAALVATGTLSANIVAVLNAAADLAASGDLAGSLSALAWATMDIEANETLAATIRATGTLTCDITPFTELSPQTLASAVWEALAVDNNDPGTMGEKLNDAGSASNPWTELIEGGMTAAQLLKLMAAAMAGKVAGAPGGPIEITGVDGSTIRITAVVDSDGNRTSVTYNVS